MKRIDIVTMVLSVALLGALIGTWHQIIAVAPSKMPAFHFLDVGQGDSELVVFPGNIKVMTDAGPDNKVLKSLARVLGDDHYIDLAIVSHPQLDHFNGFYFILDHYAVGAFIINGRNDDPNVTQWPALIEKIKAKHIPIFTLGAGDKIHYEHSVIDMLSPNTAFNESGELNDTGFVELIESEGIKAILTADTGTNIEDYLIAQKTPLRADILKVGHHGSRYSTSNEFLRAVNPKVAIIEVGGHNHYGHPSRETLVRLADAHIPIFRTDQKGTIDIIPNNSTLRIFTER